MIIAVTYENGQIFQHFGRTQQFKVYEVEGGKILNSRVVSTNGRVHGALSEVLKELNVELLICGGIGLGAIIGLQDEDIELYARISGDADEAVKKYLAGTLEYQTDIACNNHEHEEGEICGGEHSCFGR